VAAKQAKYVKGLAELKTKKQSGSGRWLLRDHGAPGLCLTRSAYCLGRASRAWESWSKRIKTIKAGMSANVREFKAAEEAPGDDDRRSQANRCQEHSCQNRQGNGAQT